MKRRSKVSLGAATGAKDSEQNFWPSYADMMSSFALILFFLMLLAYLSNMETGNNLRNTEAQLSDTLSQLTIKQAEVADTQNRLVDMQKQMEDTEEYLATVQIRLDAANAELEGKQLMLTTQQETIEAQAQYVTQAQTELEKMHGQMETIVGIRRSILEQIKQSIDTVMGDSSKVSIGENGNIILNEGVFFDSGKADLKDESVTILDRLIDVFSRFLSEPGNEKYIESIVISGHTDWDGSEENNLILSTSRADAVLTYMLNENSPLAGYSRFFCAAGYGETRPVASNETPEGKAQNRRIEISIILRDDTVMDIVNEYLNIEVPSVEAAS